jgi:hypothetical protein
MIALEVNAIGWVRNHAVHAIGLQALAHPVDAVLEIDVVLGVVVVGWTDAAILADLGEEVVEVFVGGVGQCVDFFCFPV